MKEADLWVGPTRYLYRRDSDQGAKLSRSGQDVAAVQVLQRVDDNGSVERRTVVTPDESTPGLPADMVTVVKGLRVYFDGNEAVFVLRGPVEEGAGKQPMGECSRCGQFVPLPPAPISTDKPLRTAAVLCVSGDHWIHLRD